MVEYTMLSWLREHNTNPIEDFFVAFFSVLNWSLVTDFMFASSRAEPGRDRSSWLINLSENKNDKKP